MEALARTWTSRWCRSGVHWFETEGDDRKWRRRWECPDCTALYRAAYYEAHKERALELSAAWRKANPERRRAIAVRWARANLDKIKAWAVANPEKRQAAVLRYARGPGGQRARSRRRALMAAALCEHGVRCFTQAAEAMPKVCANCGSRKHIQADHVVPLVRGGAHCGLNCQPLCRKCNGAKGAKTQQEFARLNGRLF